jgi:hypothetical protein
MATLVDKNGSRLTPASVPYLREHGLPLLWRGLAELRISLELRRRDDSRRIAEQVLETALAADLRDVAEAMRHLDDAVDKALWSTALRNLDLAHDTCVELEDRLAREHGVEI